MKVRFSLALSLLVMLISSSAAVAQTSLSENGIRFPDGTQQTTAATVAEAWPQQCSVDVAAGTTEYPTCYMYGPGDVTWSDLNGVPAGYFFIVTNVIITPATTAGTGQFGFYLYHIGGCDNGIEGGTSLARLVKVRLAPESQTWVLNSTAPFLVLSEGSCLRVDAFATNSTSAQVQYNGYLTTDPSLVRP